MDVQNNFCDLIGANGQLLPFEIHFQNLYSNTKILLHGWVLHFARIPGYQVCKIWPSGLFSMQITRSGQIL
jgi:hypothetical protein